MLKALAGQPPSPHPLSFSSIVTSSLMEHRSNPSLSYHSNYEIQFSERVRRMMWDAPNEESVQTKPDFRCSVNDRRTLFEKITAQFSYSNVILTVEWVTIVTRCQASTSSGVSVCAFVRGYGYVRDTKMCSWLGGDWLEILHLNKISVWPKVFLVGCFCVVDMDILH